MHCGAQSTWDTVELAAHAADVGADAVAVMAPPYFPLDDDELLAHLAAAAHAAAPTPFYVYEFAARSGYTVQISVLERLRESAPNLRGLKVSDTPWERFAPYLLEGLDIFVGPEALIPQGLGAGAAGAVSALASAFPELVAAAVRNPEGADLGRSAQRSSAFPASRREGRRRGSRRADGAGRAPSVRTLTDEERTELEAWLASSSPEPAR